MDLAGRRVLITGGAGVIGSHIADQLVAESVAEIVVVDNFVRGRPENLAWASAHGPVNIVTGDIRDPGLLARVTRGIDLVFHQAAIRITQCADEPRLALDVLGTGTFNVLEAAVANDVGRVVAASSASVYGQASTFPTTEDHHPYANTTLYGALKVLDEGLLRSFHDMYGLDYVALRYFNVYGPRMDVYGAYTEVLVRWMERIAAGLPPVVLGDGSQTMDFVHVADVARANILAARSDVTDEVFNVASGQETSLRELAAALLDVMASDLELDFGPERRTNRVARRLADVTKARERVGFPDPYRVARRAAGPGRVVAGAAGGAGPRANMTGVTGVTGGHRSWSPLVVMCASMPWDGPWMIDQHLATRLTRHASVLYVDPPVSRLTRLRHPAAATTWHEPPLRVLGPRLALLRPRVLPLKERIGMKAVSLALTRRAMRQAVADLGSPDVAAVIVPSLNPLFGALGERRRVFYASDDFAAGAALMGISRRRVQRWERRQTARADVVVAVSPTLAARYGGARPAVVVPNGCDSETLAEVDTAPWPDQLTVEPPVAGLLGLLSDRVDVSLLEAVADRGVSLLLVGGRAATCDAQRFEGLLARPNVTWVGQQPVGALASYLRVMDVGLLPYADTTFNRASFPLKVLEYLAAGRRVVSTDLPAVRWLNTDLVRTASDPAGFADAVVDELERPLGAGERAARRAFAATHDWDVRVDQLATVIGLLSGPAAQASPTRDNSTLEAG